MVPRWRSGAIALLSLLLVATGCEPVVDPAPERGVDPEAAYALLEGPADLSGGTVTDEAGNEYTLVQQNAPLLSTLELSRLVDGSGGSLHLAGHTLTVPPGAVSSPTVFVLSVLATASIQVELLALEASLSGYLDVGERGFATPVPLTLTYAPASNVDDPARLRILHLREDGLAEPLPSVVNREARTVTAELEHFSKYCMAMD